MVYQIKETIRKCLIRKTEQDELSVLYMSSALHVQLSVLTKVLITLSLKFILSVYLVKNRGTYEAGEGHPAAFISKEHGIPLSRLMLGMPESDSLVRKYTGAQTHRDSKCRAAHLISELSVSPSAPLGLSRQHQNPMKGRREKDKGKNRN